MADRARLSRIVFQRTYNLGSNQLIRRIRFEDGLATELTTLGYGYP